MLIKSNILFFKTALFILPEKFLFNNAKNKYSSIIVISHDNLKLPLCFGVKQKTTAIIDLSSSEDDIFRDFSDTTRNEIRKTYKIDGLKFEFFNFQDRNFRELYNLYHDFEIKQNRPPVKIKKFKECVGFGAYYNGELVSGQFVYLSFPNIRIRSIFSKRLLVEDKHIYNIISYCSRRLMWEVILWSKKNNAKIFDFASANFTNPETINISKFKMSFGGKMVNEYTYFYKSFLFNIFQKIVWLKMFIFKFKNYFLKK